MDQTDDGPMGCESFWMKGRRFNRFVLVLALPWLWLPTAQAQISLNPEYGSAPYDALTVFSPDIANPGEYADTVLVVFHGFRSAVPNGTYKRLRKRLKKNMTVIGINYDPLKVTETQQFLERVAATHLKDKRVFVLGTSLGAFWARYFAVTIRASRLVMLNPVVDAKARLDHYLGTKPNNKRRKQTYDIGPGAFDGYANMPTHYRDRPKTLLILTADDKMLDPYRTKRGFSDAPNLELAWYKIGGHTINLKKHPALDRIAQFLNAP
jgi:predicted esterase YcpF (UPF0227 family)